MSGTRGWEKDVAFVDGWYEGVRDAQRECEVVIDEDPKHIAQVQYTRWRIQGLLDGTHGPGEPPGERSPPKQPAPLQPEDRQKTEVVKLRVVAEAAAAILDQFESGGPSTAELGRKLRDAVRDWRKWQEGNK